MTFPKAASGLRLVFWAKIIELIGALAVIVLPVINIVSIIGSEDIENASLDLSLVGILAGVVLPLVGFVLALIGLIKAGKDHQSFKSAWGITVGLIIGEAALLILNLLNVMSTSSINDDFITLFSGISVIFTLEGIRALYCEKGVATGLVSTTTVIYVIAVVLEFVLSIWQSVLVENETLGLILSLILILCTIISYILYLICLAKAPKKLMK